MTLYYVDGVNGSDSNDGLSEANAKQTIQGAIDLLSGGGHTIYLQATGNYTVTSSVEFNEAGTNADGRNWIEGYTTTPGALDGRPTITSSTNGVHIVTLGANYLGLRHLNLTHTAGTRGDGLRNVSSTSAEYVKLDDVVVDGCQIGINDTWNLLNLTLERVRVINCISHGLSASSSVKVAYCYIRDNGGSGVLNPFATTSGLYLWNVIADNSSHGIHYDGSPGFLSSQAMLIGNIIANNGGSGAIFDETTATEHYQLLSNIFWGNGGYGTSLTVSGANAVVRAFLNVYNAYGSNTSGARNNLQSGFGDVTLTVDPFVDAANGDYNINSAASGGALLRASILGVNTTDAYPFRKWVSDDFGGGGAPGGFVIG